MTLFCVKFCTFLTQHGIRLSWQILVLGLEHPHPMLCHHSSIPSIPCDRIYSWVLKNECDPGTKRGRATLQKSSNKLPAASRDGANHLSSCSQRKENSKQKKKEARAVMEYNNKNPSLVQRIFPKLLASEHSLRHVCRKAMVYFKKHSLSGG